MTITHEWAAKANARIAELERENAERKGIGDSALDLLAVMFDAYEYGVSCYEDPDDQAMYVGKAFILTDEDFSRIADLLNQYRPRIDTAIATASEKEAAMPDVTMQDAINAGDGTLHGAIDHWQNRCAELEEKLKVAEEALTSALGNKGGGYAVWGPLVAAAIAKIKEAS